VFCSNVSKLVANGKKMFVTSPAGIELVKNGKLQTQSPSNSSNYMLGDLVGCLCVLYRKL
jgi:hypothetical protein